MDHSSTEGTLLDSRVKVSVWLALCGVVLVIAASLLVTQGPRHDHGFGSHGGSPTGISARDR